MKGNGSVSKKDAISVIFMAGKCPTQAELAQMEKTFGATVTFAELEEAVAKLQPQSKRIMEVVTSFEVFDKEATGFVPAADIANSMINLGEKMPQEQVEFMIRLANPNSEGMFNAEQFVRSQMAAS
eukprot:TRINITY_DN199_c0_g1_i1.p2 TRINITY_DN199_c0_g1~~TRINITY_DN199_c0_g1_i1.p2  ORF type:complete len:141 (-),score=41.89 TRINITY_DN199_c0_g1_i1:72-449(-)